MKAHFRYFAFIGLLFSGIFAHGQTLDEIKNIMENDDLEAQQVLMDNMTKIAEDYRKKEKAETNGCPFSHEIQKYLIDHFISLHDYLFSSGLPDEHSLEGIINAMLHGKSPAEVARWRIRIDSVYIKESILIQYFCQPDRIDKLIIRAPQTVPLSQYKEFGIKAMVQHAGAIMDENKKEKMDMFRKKMFQEMIKTAIQLKKQNKLSISDKNLKYLKSFLQNE